MPVSVVYHTYTNERYNVPSGQTEVITVDARGKVVEKVSMNEMVVHRLKLSILEGESLISHTSTDCGCEPLSNSNLKSWRKTVEHITAADRRSQKSRSPALYFNEPISTPVGCFAYIREICGFQCLEIMLRRDTYLLTDTVRCRDDIACLNCQG